VHGVVCGAGYLSNEWIVPDFYPTGFLPNGVRLTGYGGDASELPQAVLQEFLDAIAAGEATVPIAKTYTMDEIATAHDDMEHDRVAGKLVVSTGR
jgi:NADPH:quinone reductase-like Zn-dependent oxidoreductase